MYDFQRASMWKRISAALFDIILLSIVVTVMAYLIALAINSNAQINKLYEVRDTYEKQYEIKFSDDYNELSEEEQVKYIEAQKAMYADSDFQNAFITVVNYTFIIISFSILIGYFLVEFLPTLIFKNGQTLGKKIFGIAVMREDGVKVSPILMFIRTILGKYTVETMIPVFVLLMIYFGTATVKVFGLAVVTVIFVAQVVLFIVTKARTPMHDKLAHTVTVDFASQLIFDTKEEMVEYQKKIHEEQAEQSEETKKQ